MAKINFVIREKTKIKAVTRESCLSHDPWIAHFGNRDPWYSILFSCDSWFYNPAIQCLQNIGENLINVVIRGSPENKFVNREGNPFFAKGDPALTRHYASEWRAFKESFRFFQQKSHLTRQGV